MEASDINEQRKHIEKTAKRKKIHDFSEGPVWDEHLNRWLVEVRGANNNTDKKTENRLKKRFRRKDQAWKWWTEQQEKIRDGTWNPARLVKTTTFSEARVQFIELRRNTRSALSVKPHLRPWGRVFDQDRLSLVTEDRITEVRNRRLDDGIKKSTVDSDLAWLKSMYSWLESTGKYVNDPTRRIEYFYENDERLLYLTPPWLVEEALADQFYRLLQACNNGPWFLAPMVILSTFTGLRSGNVRGLKWSWVYLNSRTLVVPMTRAKGKKTITIPLDSMTPTEPIVYQTLCHLYETRHERGTSEYVFPHHAVPHQPITDGPFSSAWGKARIDSGVAQDFSHSHNDSFHYHDLRHTFATWHVMLGTDLYVVMKLLGHSNIEQTQRYAHLAPGFLQNNDVKRDGWLPKVFPNRRASGGESRAETATSGPTVLRAKFFRSIGSGKNQQKDAKGSRR